MSIIMESVTREQLQDFYRPTAFRIDFMFGGYIVSHRLLQRKDVRAYTIEHSQLVQDGHPVNPLVGLDIPEVIEYMHLEDIDVTPENSRVLFGDQIEVLREGIAIYCEFRFCLPKFSKYIMVITQFDEIRPHPEYAGFTEWISSARSSVIVAGRETETRYTIFKTGFRGILFDEETSRAEVIRLAERHFSA